MDLNPTAVDRASFESLLELLRGRRLVALVGAGCSTESGIPDYRGPDSVSRVRSPIQYQEFVGSQAARVRYWSRSMVGWLRIRSAQPNAAHEALARLERAGVLAGLITQNVDGLHHAAGSQRVIELHGALRRVRCLACARTVPRDDYQARLEAANATWASEIAMRHGAVAVEAAPDGDAELSPSAMEGFQIPSCGRCGGVMKPDVVFFGENVPAATVAQAWELFEAGDLLLVVGSSLTVYSGRRFIYRAERDGVPIGIVNLGPTRADAIAAARVDGRAGEVLPRLTRALLAAPAVRPMPPLTAG